MTARLCTQVLETGVRVNGEYPHCIDESRCKTRVRCFWRGFHQLADDQYSIKLKTAQKDMFT